MRAHPPTARSEAPIALGDCSEPFRSEQRVGRIAEQGHGDRAADHVVNDHGCPSSEPLSSVDRQRERRERAKRQEDVEHPVAFSLLGQMEDGPAFRKSAIRVHGSLRINGAKIWWGLFSPILEQVSSPAIVATRA
jgi:hypothetical protein